MAAKVYLKSLGIEVELGAHFSINDAISLIQDMQNCYALINVPGSDITKITFGDDMTAGWNPGIVWEMYAGKVQLEPQLYLTRDETYKINCMNIFISDCYSKSIYKDTPVKQGCIENPLLNNSLVDGKELVTPNGWHLAWNYLEWNPKVKGPYLDLKYPNVFSMHDLRTRSIENITDIMLHWVGFSPTEGEVCKAEEDIDVMDMLATLREEALRVDSNNEKTVASELNRKFDNLASTLSKLMKNQEEKKDNDES